MYHFSCVPGLRFGMSYPTIPQLASLCMYRQHPLLLLHGMWETSPWVLGRICLAKNDVHTGALDTKQAAMASLATVSGVCSPLCCTSTHLQPAEPSDSALAPSRAGTQDCTAFKGFYSSMAFKFATAPWPLVYSPSLPMWPYLQPHICGVYARLHSRRTTLRWPHPWVIDS